MDSMTMGPNVEQIRASAVRVVRGRIPREVRKELMAGGDVLDYALSERVARATPAAQESGDA